MVFHALLGSPVGLSDRTGEPTGEVVGFRVALLLGTRCGSLPGSFGESGGSVIIFGIMRVGIAEGNAGVEVLGGRVGELNSGVPFPMAASSPMACPLTLLLAVVDVDLSPHRPT